MPTPLTSLHNPKIAHIRNLMEEKTYRDDQGEFIVEGDKLIKELSVNNISYVLLSDRQKDHGLKISSELVFQVPHTLLAKISKTETPQSMLAVVKKPNYSLKNVKSGIWIMSEGIQDPGNLGTIIRTIEAAGASGLIYTSTTVDPFSPKVVRASAGSILRIPLVPVQSVVSLKKDIPSIALISTVVSAGTSYKQIKFPVFCGIILGSEGQGLLPETERLAEQKVTIPLKGKVESLNVAIAAAILLFK